MVVRRSAHVAIGALDEDTCLHVSFYNDDARGELCLLHPVQFSVEPVPSGRDGTEKIIQALAFDGEM